MVLRTFSGDHFMIDPPWRQTCLIVLLWIIIVVPWNIYKLNTQVPYGTPAIEYGFHVLTSQCENGFWVPWNKNQNKQPMFQGTGIETIQRCHGTCGSNLELGYQFSPWNMSRSHVPRKCGTWDYTWNMIRNFFETYGTHSIWNILRLVASDYHMVLVCAMW